MKKFLVKHVGNMGDMVFFIPPILEAIKTKNADCEITFVTAWGFKHQKKGWLASRSSSEGWGKRNQGGFCISLMMTNPHIDHLVHYHDTETSMNGTICNEEDVDFPTWSRKYFEQQKLNDTWDGIFELDVGILQDENPLERLYRDIGMPAEYSTNYKIYLTDSDRAIAQSVMENYPSPRIILLEGLDGRTTRGWDPAKVAQLEHEIRLQYNASTIWFGAKYMHEYRGRSLTLRENVATLTLCDAAIGVLSGPLHFAAAVGLPTITLYCDQPIHRAAPAYFLNEYIQKDTKKHRTLLGPTGEKLGFLKEGSTQINLTPQEWSKQGYVNWSKPGLQATKSCLSVITVDEVMAVLKDIVHT